MELILALTGLWVPALLLLGGYWLGHTRERAHLRRLDEQEAAYRSRILVSQLETPPDGFDSRLVLGQTVVASDYFKTVALSLRGLVGGEVKSYRSVMERARREALLRAIEQAVSAGADHLVNVRFTTTVINRTSVEVLCWGTAVRTQAVR